MSNNTQIIQQLRQMTGCGISDCQQALIESSGDLQKAVEILRKKGIMKASKKMGRSANEGVIGSYVHANGRAGALVEVHCETDFVARTKDFQNLIHDIAMQIVALGAKYIRPEDIPEKLVEEEKEVYRSQLRQEKKPDHVINKILDGKMQKYFEEVCLLRQSFIKDESMTVQELIDQHVAKLGEKIEVVRFCHLVF